MSRAEGCSTLAHGVGDRCGCPTLTIGAIVCCYRYYDRSKPPVVDLATLSEDEIEVLTKCRHRALKVLRSRGVVAYKDFDAYDAAPLWEASRPVGEPRLEA